ncbi:MAG: 2-thiouracil desulfurase family protein [Bacteroidota bacterium]
MTDKTYLHNLRIPTSDDPLRILTSACLMGTLCGADGSSYGSYPHMLEIAANPLVQITSFCPEDHVFGTPREIPDIEGGHGADVLDQKAKVVMTYGKDVSQEMVAAAHQMLKVAQQQQVELAIMMDVSAACGSQVIYKGHRTAPNPAYQIGMGVCAALLKRHGIQIISQRDFFSLEILLSKIDPNHTINQAALDHDQTEWYQTYFGPEMPS